MNISYIIRAPWNMTYIDVPYVPAGLGHKKNVGCVCIITPSIFAFRRNKREVEIPYTRWERSPVNLGNDMMIQSRGRFILCSLFLRLFAPENYSSESFSSKQTQEILNGTIHTFISGENNSCFQTKELNSAECVNVFLQFQNNTSTFVCLSSHLSPASPCHVYLQWQDHQRLLSDSNQAGTFISINYLTPRLYIAPPHVD